MITERFALNVARVRDLIAWFRKLRPRARTPADDILRAAVVLLHATLEDLLRSLEELTLQAPPRSALRPISFPPEPGKARGEPKFTLMDLHARFRGQSVDAVVRQAIDAHLEQQSYSHIGELNDALMRLGLTADGLTRPFARELAALMKRRHWIAHRADVGSNNPRNFLHLQGVASIDPDVVALWLTIVERLGHQILTAFPEQAS